MRSQDDPGRGRRHPADGLQLLLAGIRARQVVDDGTQVLQVQQGQPLGVGPVEDQLEGRGLSVVEAQDAGEQDRPELGDGGADRCSLTRRLLAGTAQGKQLQGERLRRPLLPGSRDTRRELVTTSTRFGQAGEIPFDIGQEDRYAGGAQPLGEELKGAGLTRIMGV